MRRCFGGPVDLPKTCEIVRLWEGSPSGDLRFCGLLLDSPEPLLRRLGEHDQTTLTPANRCLTGRTGARVLLAEPPVSNGTVALTFRYVPSSADQPITQTLIISIPSNLA